MDQMPGDIRQPYEGITSNHERVLALLNDDKKSVRVEYLAAILEDTIRDKQRIDSQLDVAVQAREREVRARARAEKRTAVLEERVTQLTARHRLKRFAFGIGGVLTGVGVTGALVGDAVAMVLIGCCGITLMLLSHIRDPGRPNEGDARDADPETPSSANASARPSG